MSRTEFTIDPALLRATQTYRVENGHLTHLADNDTPDWTLDLRTVQDIAYSEITVKLSVIRQLDLVTPDGVRRLSQTLAISDRGPSRTGFTDLVVALLRAVADLHPDMKITYGLQGKSRTALFVVSMLSVAAGVALPVAMLATNASLGRLWAASTPSLLLILMGAAYGWPNRPWKPLPRLPLAQLVQMLEPTNSPAAP